jgi:hypothetical protein
MVRVSLILFLWLYSTQLNAQLAIGLSANIGNQLNFEPSSKGLGRPPAVSGNLMFYNHDKLKNGWTLDSGVDLGVVGYTLKIVSIDTILDTGVSKFYEYATLYGSLGVMLSKNIAFFNKTLSLGLGGGATLYYPLPNVSFGIGIASGPNSPSYDLFEAKINSPEYGFSGFLKTGLQFDVSPSLILGCNYQHHFSRMFTGTFEFFHTAEPTAGTFYLYQREIRLYFLYLVQKKY